MSGPIILPNGQPKWPPTWGDALPECCCEDITRYNFNSCQLCAIEGTPCDVPNVPSNATVTIQLAQPWVNGTGFFRIPYVSPAGTYSMPLLILRDQEQDPTGCEFTTGICGAGPAPDDPDIVAKRWESMLNGEPLSRAPIGVPPNQMFYSATLFYFPQAATTEFTYFLFKLNLNCAYTLNADGSFSVLFAVRNIPFNCTQPNGTLTPKVGIDCNRSYSLAFGPDLWGNEGNATLRFA